MFVTLVAASVSTPIAAQGASGFSVVNATGLNMTGLTIRRYGTQGWKALGTAPSPGGRGAVDFKDPDCAFDIQATFQGVGSFVCSGVNLFSLPKFSTSGLNKNA